MRYQFTISLFIIYAVYSTIIAQKHDYVWLMGENSLTVPEYAGTVIDFNIQPPDIYYEFRDMFFFSGQRQYLRHSGQPAILYQWHIHRQFTGRADGKWGGA